MIQIQNLDKTYQGGFQALKGVDLDIKRGEIFALLGPNGAGKTTMISIICGIVNATSGRVLVDGHDIETDFRNARSLVGLVPQELPINAFDTVKGSVEFSRGVFGLSPNPELIEGILKDLTLWDKKDTRMGQLSGGMKRRMLIAKALAHEPKVLFLDEPTAGVDVELRNDMWRLVRRLRDQGVTIILTTHYIEEAEEMSDRVGVINHGELILVEETETIMKKLGKKELIIELEAPFESLPSELDRYNLNFNAKKTKLIYEYDPAAQDKGIATLLEIIKCKNIRYKDLMTTQSSLEDIFVGLVKKT